MPTFKRKLFCYPKVYMSKETKQDKTKNVICQKAYNAQNNDVELTFDPFDDPASLLPDLTQEFDKKVHIRLQQRSNKKSITIVEGLDDVTGKGIIPKLRSKLGCSGTLKEGAIQFSGDQRRKIIDFLIEEKLARKQDIVLHGY